MFLLDLTHRGYSLRAQSGRVLYLCKVELERNVRRIGTNEFSIDFERFLVLLE